MIGFNSTSLVSGASQSTISKSSSDKKTCAQAMPSLRHSERLQVPLQEPTDAEACFILLGTKQWFSLFHLFFPPD